MKFISRMFDYDNIRKYHEYLNGIQFIGFKKDIILSYFLNITKTIAETVSLKLFLFYFLEKL